MPRAAGAPLGPARLSFNWSVQVQQREGHTSLHGSGFGFLQQTSPRGQRGDGNSACVMQKGDDETQVRPLDQREEFIPLTFLGTPSQMS